MGWSGFGMNLAHWCGLECVHPIMNLWKISKEDHLLDRIRNPYKNRRVTSPVV